MIGNIQSIQCCNNFYFLLNYSHLPASLNETTKCFLFSSCILLTVFSMSRIRGSHSMVTCRFLETRCFWVICSFLTLYFSIKNWFTTSTPLPFALIIRAKIYYWFVFWKNVAWEQPQKGVVLILVAFQSWKFTKWEINWSHR